MAKLAFLVDSQDQGSVVVFAADAMSAAHLGSARLGTHPETCSVSRANQYDSFSAAGEVPLEVLLQDGWEFACDHCGEPLAPGKCFTEDRLVFCSGECLEAKAQEVQRVNEEFEGFKALLLERYKELSWSEFMGGWPILTPVARFTFPGSLWGGGQVIAQKSGALCWMITAGDQEAWEKYQQTKTRP